MDSDKIITYIVAIITAVSQLLGAIKTVQEIINNSNKRKKRRFPSKKKRRK